MENNYFIRGNSIYKNEQLLCSFEEKTIWDGKRTLFTTYQIEYLELIGQKVQCWIILNVY